MLRAFILIALLLSVSACQTGGADTESVLDSAAVDQSQDVPEAEKATEVKDEEAPEEQIENVEPEKTEARKPEPKAKNKATGDVVEIGVRRIAKIRNKQGERGAVEAIFACYKSARRQSASLDDARVCAAQDFVVSREVLVARPKTATGKGDRAFLISKRHTDRIGALMKLKGMNQSQFNTFGRYLHAVAEPTYKKARKS